MKQACFIHSGAIVAAALFLAACGSASTASTAPAKISSAASSVPAKTSSAGASTPANSASPKPQASGAALTTIKYSVSGVLVTYWEDYVADAKNFWEANGVKPEVIITNTSAGGTQALLSNGADISDHSVDSAVLADEKGADLLDVGDTIAAPVYSLIGAKNVKTYADLKGKNIAISDLKSGPTIILKRMLEANGLSEKSVTLLQSGGTPQRVAALESGAVQGGLLLPPSDFLLLDKGYNLIGYSTDVVKKQTFNAVIVRKTWAEKNGDTLVRFLKAKKQAIDWLHDPKNKDEAVRILATKLKTTPDVAAKTYDVVIGKTHMFARGLVPDPEGLQDVINTLGALGDLQNPLPKPEKFITDVYAKQALK